MLAGRAALIEPLQRCVGVAEDAADDAGVLSQKRIHPRHVVQHRVLQPRAWPVSAQNPRRSRCSRSRVAIARRSAA
jgi:hypothetical protein